MTSQTCVTGHQYWKSPARNQFSYFSSCSLEDLLCQWKLYIIHIVWFSAFNACHCHILVTVFPCFCVQVKALLKGTVHIKDRQKVNDILKAIKNGGENNLQVDTFLRICGHQAASNLGGWLVRWSYPKFRAPVACNVIILVARAKTWWPSATYWLRGRALM